MMLRADSSVLSLPTHRLRGISLAQGSPPKGAAEAQGKRATVLPVKFPPWQISRGTVAWPAADVRSLMTGFRAENSASRGRAPCFVLSPLPYRERHTAEGEAYGDDLTGAERFADEHARTQDANERHHENGG